MQSCSSEVVRSQLDRILSSEGFARNDRLSGFLKFVVEQELSECGDQIKESIIGVEVFGRRPDYDVRQDSVVRTEAGKLRARLAKYYAAEGAASQLIIELPKGGYRPVFLQAEQPPQVGALQQHPKKRWSAPRWAIVAAWCVVVSLAAVGWWLFQHQTAPIPIAVLPLKNLSQDPAADYFADGLTSEIIRNLSIIDGLAVRSQTSSFAFKGKQQNIRDAGKQLDAEYILEGSVFRSGQQLRINSRLVRVRDDFPLWTGNWDEELTDVFAIQDKISRGIVNSLRLKIGRGRRRYETSVEAYDLYLRARALPIQRGLNGYDESIVPLEEAIRKDPSFAPAYASLAAAHAFRSGQFRFNLAAEMSLMRVAAQKAIQLDPLLAEAHSVLGMSYSRDAQWQLSEKSFRRAIELDPGLSESHEDFAFFVLFPLGRIEEALHHLQVAEKADPLSAKLHYKLASVLISAGRPEEAAAYCQKLPADFELKTEYMGEARLHQGRIEEAIRMLETEYHPGAERGAPLRGSLGCAYARAGRREDAEKIAADSSFNPLNQAYIFACLGDKDRTLEALDRAAAAGPFRMGRTLNRDGFALLRGDPRLKALRKKVGLPE